MTNREFAIQYLRDLINANVVIGGALQRAFYLLDKASVEKRDLDNRELAMIDELAKTISPELVNQLSNKGGVSE